LCVSFLIFHEYLNKRRLNFLFLNGVIAYRRESITIQENWIPLAFAGVPCRASLPTRKTGTELKYKKTFYGMAIAFFDYSRKE